MAQKRKAKQLTVKASTQLTKNMLRLTLHGEELSDLPADSEGAYFKLVFDSANPERPIMRTYTISQYRQNQCEIDVDFMLHGDAKGVGVAAPWAVQAKVGDPVAMFGPGPATFVNLQADWYLLAADMTALPALTSNLSLLPDNATGYLVIEILSEDDQQALLAPKDMEVVWVVNPHPGSDASPLCDAIKKIEWLDGQPAIWAACEFKTMKKIRQHFRAQSSVHKSHLYVSSYWKQGLNEEEHKVAKKEDAQ